MFKINTMKTCGSESSSTSIVAIDIKVCLYLVSSTELNSMKHRFQTRIKVGVKFNDLFF